MWEQKQKRNPPGGSNNKRSYCGQRLWGPQFKRWSSKAQFALQAAPTDIMSQVCKALSIEHWYCLQRHASRTQQLYGHPRIPGSNGICVFMSKCPEWVEPLSFAILSTTTKRFYYDKNKYIYLHKWVPYNLIFILAMKYWLGKKEEPCENGNSYVHLHTLIWNLWHPL